MMNPQQDLAAYVEEEIASIRTAIAEMRADAEARCLAALEDRVASIKTMIDAAPKLPDILSRSEHLLVRDFQLPSMGYPGSLPFSLRLEVCNYTLIHGHDRHDSPRSLEPHKRYRLVLAIVPIEGM